MITEDYVNFEISKLLKEKGFDWKDSPFEDPQALDEWRLNNYYMVPNPEFDPEIPWDSEYITVIVPHVTLQKAMKWLREVHGLYVHVDCIGSANWKTEIQSYEGNDYPVENGAKRKITGELGYDTYEEAAEAAIKYALENLI